MSDIDTEYGEGMFHTGQYELNEDIVDGEFDAWLASVKAEALREAATTARAYSDGNFDKAWHVASILDEKADRIEQGDNR